MAAAKSETPDKTKRDEVHIGTKKSGFRIRLERAGSCGCFVLRMVRAPGYQIRYSPGIQCQKDVSESRDSARLDTVFKGISGR